MNRLACMLTGGHRYNDLYLKVTDMNFPMNDYFVISNHCEKCGKMYRYEISKKAVFSWLKAKEDMGVPHDGA